MRKDFQAKQLGIAMDDEELIKQFIRTERGKERHMANEMSLHTFTLEDTDGDTWEETIEGETVELARKKLADLQRRAVKYGSAEVVSIAEGAVPKSKKDQRKS